MNEYLNRQLDQISKLISGLKGGEVDLEKLTELDRSLEVLSHQIKTARLADFAWSPDDPARGLKQDALFFFNRQYQVVRFVGAYENIFGRAKNDSLPEVNWFFEPAEFDRFCRKTELLLETGESQSFASEIISKNGLMLPVYFLLETVSFGQGTEVVAAGMVFFSQTPSDLEDYREILIENLPGMDVYLFDNQFTHVLAGGREKERLGLTNADFSGKTLFEVYDEKTRKRLFPFYRNSLDGKVSEGEVRIKGNVYFVSATPVYGFNRQVVGGAIILQNVTKEKEVEKNLINARRQAEEADRAKSVFLANMSHEIRTPLNAIIGFTGLLEKTELTPKQKKFSRLINQSSGHLLSVVNEVLFLFKLGMGKVYIEKVPFNAHELIQNVHESLLFRAKEKGLEFRYQIEPGVSEVLVGDPFRLKQILMNLAGNAIKFTDDGEISIRVSSEKMKRKAVFIRFQVYDTGIGISREDLKIIFDEFAQSNLGNEKKRKGAGLGLTIVRKLVDLLGGRLHVDSEPGKGSEFTVVIPFEKPREGQAVPKEKTFGSGFDRLNGKRILYADDDENNILLAESILKEWNVEFELATDGTEAMQLINNILFDAVLLDIHMPGLSGVEVVQMVKSNRNNVNYNTKMLAVTANVMKRDIRDYLNSGFDDYMLKPFKEEELYSKICSLLGLEQTLESLVENHVEPNKAAEQESSVFNTSQLMHTAGGDLAFFNQMIDTFIDGAKNAVHGFREGIQDKDWKRVGKIAHKAIPSFRYFGLVAVADNLEKIENMTLRNKEYEAAGELASQVQEEIMKIIQAAESAKIPDGDN
ncbi:MAG TPA: PAS domain-containing sensor histidine kinase [Mariniphaga anaerophila]|uniref:histidine kinase n=1 Tax=Mariniphaga anaerophila TaxID=1484053 RepID=A0A831LXN8_9BACT|nr:PAS domain-containing sensor histidine kinase [Mariniphaga anaerophila]